MQMQVEAERKKRAAILESEGVKVCIKFHIIIINSEYFAPQASEINIAEGDKQAKILASEAEKTRLINQAVGAAEAVIVAGEARAKSIEAIAQALASQKGTSAANLAVAENYVKAFGNLAKSSNTLMLPGNAGDISTMVTQALSIYKKLDVQEIDTETEQAIQEEKVTTKS